MKVPKLTRDPRKALRRAQHSVQSKQKEIRSKRASDQVLKVPKPDAIKQHQQELLDLEKSDPEFFEFLRDNDANLLNFADDDDEEDGTDDIQDEEEDQDEQALDEEKDSHKLQSQELIEVDESFLTFVLEKSKSGNIKALKRLFSIFRAACAPQGIKGEYDESNVGVRSRYLVNDPHIYERIMSEIFEAAYLGLDKILQLSEFTKNAESLSKLNEHPKWNKVKPMVQSFFKSLMFTLSSLIKSNTSGHIAAYLLSSMESLIPLLAPLPRLTKNFINVLLGIWSTNNPITSEDNSRIYAYLRVRQMSLILPGPVAEECFRLIYLTFARSTKTFNAITSSSVSFMSKCIVELYLTDVSMAYQLAFMHIRQLALLLRSTILKKTAEASKQILSWQYLNCVRLWTRVICAMPLKEDLGELAFPLAQVILGVLTAAPSSVHIPLRFHLISCLQQLAAHCQLFIPTASKLFDVLECADLFSKPVPTTELPPNLYHIIRIPPDACSKANIRDLLVSQAITMLQLDTEIYRYNVGFPEYVFMIIKKLKAFMKKSKISRWRDLSRSLANQLEQHSAHVKKLRAQLGKPPMDITEFEPLLPKNTNAANARLAKLIADHSADDSAEVTVSTEITEYHDIDDDLTQHKRGIQEIGQESASGKKNSKKSTLVQKTSANATIPLEQLADEVGELEWSEDEDAET